MIALAIIRYEIVHSLLFVHSWEEYTALQNQWQKTAWASCVAYSD